MTIDNNKFYTSWIVSLPTHLYLYSWDEPERAPH